MKVKSNAAFSGEVELEGKIKSSGGNLEFFVGNVRVLYIDSNGDVHVKGDVIIESTSV